MGSLFFFGECYVRSMVVLGFFRMGCRMRAYRNQSFISVLVLSWSLMFVPIIEARAQAAAAFTGRLNGAIASMIIQKLAGWGISSSDPRVAATVKGVSAGLTVIASGAIGTGTAVSWPVLLGAAGIAGLVSGGVYLVQKSGYEWKWGWDSGGKFIIGGFAPGAPASVPGMNLTPLVAGGSAYVSTTYDYVNGNWDYSNPHVQTATDPVFLAIVVKGGGSPQYTSCGPGPSGYPAYRCYVSRGPTGADAVGVVDMVYQASSVSSPTGYNDNRPPPNVVVAPVTYNTAQEAANAAIPDSIKNQPVTPAALAAAVNAAWKVAQPANQSGGVPWSASDPVTPSDASSWITANPTGVPVVGDFSSSATATAGSPTVGIGTGTGGISGTGGSGTGTGSGTGSGSIGGVGDPTTGTGDTTAPPTTPGTGTEINWGPNPNIGLPTLETTPTKESILDPIFNVMPDLKSFAVPGHMAECPVAAFSVYGRQFRVDAHCSLLEQNRALIGACMVLAFTLAAFFIVLRA